jgi:peptide/nickel transport system substrate-binding protein
VQISYKMQEGILWFDGEPLTAADSVFSYQVALEIYGTTGSAKTRYTNSYELVEEQGLFWKGLPGYLGIYDYTEQFFAPLPEHLWSNLSREELLTSAQTTQMPLGWGAYRVVEWVRGDHISLVKNPNYHASSQGLPTYDSLVFRFVDGGEDALAAFASGECAIVIKEQDLFNYLPEIDSLVRSGAANRIVYDLPSWEQISFGVNSLDPSRNLLPDPRTRQAIASCINREEIAAQRADAGTWVDNLFHPNDPRSDPELDPRVFQPQEGVKLLEELGWVDHDQDFTTPRISRGVHDLANDVAFQLTLLEGRSEGSSQTALMIKDQLSRCGIEVTIESLLPGDLFAPGPEGPVFGRKFDLALFAWSTGNYQLCKIFTTSEIPGQYPGYAKGWGGTNATGFSQAEYDQACEYLLTSLSGTGESLEETNHIQAIFQEELPVLPLFFRQDLILVNPAVGEIQPGNYHPLWNIEYFQ